MRVAVLAFLFAASVFAQGWTGFTGTTFVPGACPSGGWYAEPGHVYTLYSDYCYTTITAWTGAVADTKRNRLVIWGGGHSATPDNSVYRLDPVAKTIERLTDPSTPGEEASPGIIRQADGNPVQRHTYDSLVYLPKSDKMFAWAGADRTNTQQSQNIWLFDFATRLWQEKQPTGLPSGIVWAHCVLDPTTDNESVLCIVQGNALYRYDVVADTWTTLVAWNSFSVSGGSLQTGGTAVVDPDRKLLFLLGATYSNNPQTAGTGRAYAIDLTSATYATTDWTSDLVAGGCQAAIDVNYPGVEWDTSLNRIVIYPITGNTVYVMDPATKTCVAQTFSGGPTASSGVAAQGIQTKFRYFPTLGYYVVLNNQSANAYKLQLHKTPTNGLGASTITCIDRDGDGYGVGPGCTGVDADDQDADVHTGAQALTKWTNMAGYLAHLGYNPAHIWYVAPTGNDATGARDNVSAPFQTCCGAGKANPAAGDMVMLRGGDYAFTMLPPSGTAGNPVIVMSYPGEVANFNAAGSGIDIGNKSWIVVDGYKATGNWAGTKAGLYAGANSNIALRHIDASMSEWGISGFDITDFAVEDSVLHDNLDVGCGTAQHGIYLGHHNPATTSRDVFIRRTLTYNNCYNGIQVNGNVTNLLLEQNIAYSNQLSGFSLETGVNNSRILNNVAFDNGRSGLIFYNYPDFCAVYDPGGAGTTCPYAQNYNLIENFTVYNTGKDPTTGLDAQSPAIQVANTSTNKIGDMGHNTFRNVILASWVGTGYSPIQFDDAEKDYLSTSTFDNLIVQHTDGATTDVFSRGTVAAGNFERATCAQAASWTTLTGCSRADPKFVAANPVWYATPASFNLRLQATSPAATTGSTVRLPLFDLTGTARSFSAPSLGAYQYTGSVASGTRFSGSATFTGGKMQ